MFSNKLTKKKNIYTTIPSDSVYSSKTSIIKLKEGLQKPY